MMDKNDIRGSQRIGGTVLPHYVGGINPNCDYHHGGLPLLPGVRCVQAVRANRQHPELADGTDSTYKHAPDLTYFKGRFYLQYLCNPVDEHEPGGYSVLAFAEDDLVFKGFTVSFPRYLIPKCTVTDYKGSVHSFDGSGYAFMHQRMSFYISSAHRLLLLGFYGWSPEKWMTNWDNYGIGRVVREIYEDGTLSDIYFIRPNWQAGWTEELLAYPLYDKSPDEGFVNACRELLADKLYVQQWAEENGDIDELITIKHPGGGRTYQAFNWYHIDDKNVVGLWKHSLAAVSHDGGEHWSDVTVSPSLVMSGQKIWGEALSDGTFALCYDPTLETQHRYPLCIVSGSDGYEFDNMRVLHGEVPMKRYAGFWKDYGPQYMRGISEGFGEKLKDLYLAYSVNKEDIWVAKIRVPLKNTPAPLPAEGLDIADCPENWHIYTPSWATAGPTDETAPKGRTAVMPAPEHATEAGGITGRVFAVTDGEPVDRAVLTRPFPETAKLKLSFVILARPTEEKPVFVDICGENHIPAVRIVFRANGAINVRTVTELGFSRYTPGEAVRLTVEADCGTFSYTLTAGPDRKYSQRWETENISAQLRFMSAVNSLSMLQIYTGKTIKGPSLDDDPEIQKDLAPKTQERAAEAGFLLY